MTSGNEDEAVGKCHHVRVGEVEELVDVFRQFDVDVGERNLAAL